MSIKATFTNTPTNKGKSRILYDIKNITKDSECLAKEGLYFSFPSVGHVFSTKYSMLIIGPEDTPYTGGFYMFDAQFPDQYPYRPMKMKSITQGGDIRKHPNLYRSGKCCFSFLGTWAGPPWTACQNPSTVGISMRSVFTKNPIINEPGWEKKHDARTKLYEDLVRFFNIKYAVINVVKNHPKQYNLFYKQIIAVFKKNYTIYKNEIKKLAHLDSKDIKSPVYNFSANIDCTELNRELDALYSSLTASNSPPVESIQVNILPVNNSDQPILLGIKSKSTPIRKCPKKPAKFFMENCCMVGLDGREWIVKQYTNGSRRWVIKS